MFNEYPYINISDLNLDYLIKKLKALDGNVTALNSWKATFEEQLGTFNDFIAQIEAGKMPENMIVAVKNWLSDNAIDFMGELVNMVIFNITDDGYFVAYIPESWDEIEFGTTGLDTTIALQPNYGHLVLSYEASTNAY